MQCPACSHDGSAVDFGTPARCPECGAFYEKALVARAKRNELSTKVDERQQRQQRTEQISESVIGLGDSVVRHSVAAMNSKFLRNPWVLGGLVLVITTLVLLVQGKPNGYSRAGMAERSQPREPDEWAVNEVGKRAVLARLRDQNSAQFRGQFVGKSGAPCGEVNSKNAFGGYGGYQRYIASGGGLVYFEEDVAADVFGDVWSQLCK